VDTLATGANDYHVNAVADLGSFHGSQEIARRLLVLLGNGVPPYSADSHGPPLYLK
jgi:hypothetical protein